MSITIFYRTQQFQKDFDACADTVLKQEIEIRLEKLEKQPDTFAIHNLLHRYAPHVFVMKIFGQHNARIVIQEQKFKGAILYFIRLLFDKSQYAEWRDWIKPNIYSGLWVKKAPLSKYELEMAFGQYQKKETANKIIFRQKRVRDTKSVPAYMNQDWFFRELQYANSKLSKISF
ncbi:MAG: hypothetical protein JNL70_13935 [Saprospiraceae bacterium]|nr:hypothetical protein [Saprospiraceae bacterium]